jgi:Carboxypeptidase regulatory-like domain
MIRKSPMLLLKLALWLSLLSTSTIYGQATYSSIVGTCRDESRAVLPNVAVTIKNDATGVSFTEVTNELGDYSFKTLTPGTYTIHAEIRGFRPVDIRGAQLQVSQIARYDLTMQLGEVSDTVQVSASLAVLSTETSDVGQVINNRQIVDLPLNGRSYLQLATLTNGVADAGAVDSSPGPGFVSQGNRATGSSFLIGGVDTRNQREGGYGLSLSIDAVDEFKILQNSFSAEYGRGSTVVNATIKPGTNNFHGTLFEFVRNDLFDARNAFDFRENKPPLRQNQFGGSLGGPILPNKTFFFVNYEGERVRSSGISYTNMPSQAQLGGNLSTMTQLARDPLTGELFTGNVIPAERISQFAKAGARYFRAPTGSPLANFNYTAVLSSQRNGDQGTVRIDHNFSKNIRLDGFLSIYEMTTLTQAVNEYSGELTTAKTKPAFAVQYTHILSPTLLNVLRGGYYRSVRYRGQDRTAESNVAAADFGLKNISPEPFAYAPPGISIVDFAFAGAQPWQPTGATDGNLQLNNVTTLSKGRHSLKFGADLRWLQYDDLGWAIQNGGYTFNGQYTGNALADYLLGLPSFAQAALRGIGKYSYELRHGEYSFFAQDDFKITPQLTINTGLRYELVQFPLEINDQYSNWNFEKMTMDFAGKDIPRRILPMDKNNFGPRLGFAYSPRFLNKTVFRGGFGMMYGNFRQYESGLQHFHPPYVNENFLSNDVPKPSFTTETLWAAPVTDLTGADLSGTTVNYLRDKTMPLIYQWNFNIQRELPRNFLFQIGYVGNRGVNQPNRYDANQAAPYDPANPRTIVERRPYKRLGFVSANTSQTYSSYHGLDVHLERRFSGGLSLIGNYTWSKLMGIRAFDNYTVMLIDNIRHNYGPQGNAHTSVISYIYELPFGPGKSWLGGRHGVLSHLAGGWQLNGITTIRSGGYLSIGSSVNNGVGSRAGNKADSTGQPANLPREERTSARWFNTNAFVDPPHTRYGTSGEGVVVGPGSINFDLSLFKIIRIAEGKSLQFRMEAFNAFNHVNLGNPGLNVSAQSNFGQINSAAAARIVQFGLKFLF